jgi:hypothetical protein
MNNTIIALRLHVVNFSCLTSACNVGRTVYNFNNNSEKNNLQYVLKSSDKEVWPIINRDMVF